jgi:hypothetical protein
MATSDMRKLPGTRTVDTLAREGARSHGCAEYGLQGTQPRGGYVVEENARRKISRFSSAFTGEVRSLSWEHRCLSNRIA